MPTPFVSILMPAYNAELWLAQAIESVLAQTWTDWELIVVDDGSRDNTLNVARRFESSRVKVVAQENAGASVARNTAYSHAQGTVIQYLDADDLMAPEKIALQVRALEARGDDFVASCAWARFTHDIGEAVFRSEPAWGSMPPVDWLVCSWNGGGMMHPAAWLTPRSICERAGPWNPMRCPNDDGEYFCRVLLASRGIVFVPEAKVYYRSNVSGSLSGRRDPAAIESIFTTLTLCDRYLLRAENSPRTRQAIANNYQRFAYEQYPDFPGLVGKAEQRIQELGGSNLRFAGGWRPRLVSTLIGWKGVRRIQKTLSLFRSRLRQPTCCH